MPLLRQWQGGRGQLHLSSASQIVLDATYASQLQATARVFQQDLSLETGWTLAIKSAASPGTGNFFLTLQTRDRITGNEGYLLTIAASATINAWTANGIFYGTRTVLQILQNDPEHAELPRGSALDYPDYPERGFMLDVGRKFVPLNVLENYIRLLSWYKFNDLQLHLNDNAINGGQSTDWQHQYAAFRLNSPAFPGLAATDGSYDEQDIHELVQFAQEHAITITPEIDTPAHALALTQYRPDLASPSSNKEFLNLDNPATYPFIDSIWNTFLPWFTTSQVNMGMDEYDTNDASAYRKYIEYSNRFLRQKDKTTRMWGSLSAMQSPVSIDTNIVIEDWNNVWANPVTMDHQGFSLINTNDALLYIVPHANYYHDYLDTREIYTSWTPSVFSLTNKALNLQPDDPHLLGGMFAVWNDLFKLTSVTDITARIEPAAPVVGEKMWNASISGTSYTSFEQTLKQIGPAPGSQLP